MMRPGFLFRSMRAFAARARSGAVFSAAWALAALSLASCGAGNNETPASNDPKEIALVRIEPADGESSVPRNRVVRLYFNTLVLPESVTDQSLQVRTGGTFQTRPEGSFLVNAEIVEFDPRVTVSGGSNAAGFPAGAQIQIVVPLRTPGSNEPDVNFLQNIEGNPIVQSSGDNTIVFTTGAGWLDTVPGAPGALRLDFTPGKNTAGQVRPDAAVTIVTNEALDPSSVLLGRNIFLTNNTATSPFYRQGIPSITFADGSLTRFTFQPVFGFGQGPFNIQLNFFDPLNPEDFDPAELPTDLGGSQIANFAFLETFDTQFDPSALNTGLIVENFKDVIHRDPVGTDALWGDDTEVPFALVAQKITTRIQDVDILTIVNVTGTGTGIAMGVDGAGLSRSRVNFGGLANLNALGNEDYCATVNPLVGPDLPVGGVGQPATADGRRRQNLYRTGELGGNGTIIRAAWGPDSDAIFAATYPNTIVRVGHHKGGTPLSNGGLFSQFDVDGYVQVAGPLTYQVGQAANLGGPTGFDGYYDWPSFQTFFDFDGINDLLVDIEAQEGNTYQGIRTFLAVSQLPGGAVCDCVTIFGGQCNVAAGSPFRQGDTVWGSDILNPSPSAAIANPAPFVNVMEFELAKLRSDAQSLWYDSLVEDPDYLTPILTPIVQPGGSSIEITWSGSVDGITEDVPFTSNINACDGLQYIRFHTVMRSNIFTGGRPRIDRMEIPYTFSELN